MIYKQKFSTEKVYEVKGLPQYKRVTVWYENGVYNVYEVTFAMPESIYEIVYTARPGIENAILFADEYAKSL